MSAITTISAISEPDEFEAALNCGGQVVLAITGSGRFRARLTNIALARMRLMAIEELLSRIAFVVPPQGWVMVLLPVGRDVSRVWAGERIGPDEVATLCGATGVHGRTDGPCRSTIICLPSEDLARYGRSLTGADFAVPRGLHRWSPGREALRSLTGLSNAAFRLSETDPDAAANSEALHGLRQELLAGLVECLANGAMAPERGPAARYPDLMARLEELIGRHPEGLPHVTDVCAALQVSGRTLQTYCRQHLGLSPARYLRLRQLQRIRHALRSADTLEATVSALARRHGIRQLGRFAAQYRARFGEPPSATLRGRRSP